MRTFTVTAHSVTVGIRVYMDPFPHIRMGNIGPHQTALRVPLAPHEWSKPPRRIRQCNWRWVKSSKKERSEMQLLITPEKKSTAKKHEKALVLVDIRGKEGGTAAWTTARKTYQPCPLIGTNGGIYEQCPMCWGEYDRGRHPPTGEYHDFGPFPVPSVEIVKKSHIRYGNGHPSHPDITSPQWAQVMLLSMAPNAIFRVNRGYGKGVADERLVRWNGAHMELGTADELLDERLVISDEPLSDPSLELQPSI